VVVDDEFSIKVASLPGIFILKLAAFNDRKLSTDKDASDMAFIIKNYLAINETRAIHNHYDLYEDENFSVFKAGAALLGRDIMKILNGDNDTLLTFIDILENELELAEESLLLNQIEIYNTKKQRKQ
jgi:predicted nucleotidyltransferase